MSGLLSFTADEWTKSIGRSNQGAEFQALDAAVKAALSTTQTTNPALVKDVWNAFKNWAEHERRKGKDWRNSAKNKQIATMPEDGIYRPGGGVLEILENDLRLRYMGQVITGEDRDLLKIMQTDASQNFKAIFNDTQVVHYASKEYQKRSASAKKAGKEAKKAADDIKTLAEYARQASARLSVPLPNLDIGLPRINLPNLPNLGLNFAFPKLPTINFPAVPSFPDFPDINLPTLPHLNLPPLPTINFPHLDLPSIPSFSINRPKFPSFDGFFDIFKMEISIALGFPSWDLINWDLLEFGLKDLFDQLIKIICAELSQAAPFVGVATSSAKLASTLKRITEENARSFQLLDLSKKMNPGHPKHAIETVINWQNKQIEIDKLTAATQTANLAANIATVVSWGAAEGINIGSAIAGAIVRLKQLASKVGIQYKERNRLQDYLQSDDVSPDILVQSPLAASYFILNSNTSAILNSFLQFGSPSYMQDAQMAIRPGSFFDGPVRVAQRTSGLVIAGNYWRIIPKSGGIFRETLGSNKISAKKSWF